MEVSEIFTELEEIKQEILRGKARNLKIGEHRSIHRGVGFNVKDVNRWELGDPIESIDWGLSLLTWPGTIYKLEKIEEKETPLILVADISPSVFTEVDEYKSKFRLLLHLIGALSFTAKYFKDPVGIVCVSDKIEFYLRPKFGQGQIFYAVNLILEKHQSFDETRRKRGLRKAQNTDLNAALRIIVERVKGQSTVIVLSDFIDVIHGDSTLDDGLLKVLLERTQFNVIPIFLNDPQEFNWTSKGRVSVRNIESGEFTEIKAERAKEVRQSFNDKREALRTALKKDGVDSVVLNFGNHFYDLAQFLSERRAAHI